MLSSLVPKLVLCGLLILTLSYKVSNGMSQSVSGQEQDEMVRTQIAMFLARTGSNQIASPQVQNPIGVSGRSGGCQLLIAEAAFQGWHRDSLRRSASEKTNSFSFSGATCTRTNPSG